jgi:hypothetical protein
VETPCRIETNRQFRKWLTRIGLPAADFLADDVSALSEARFQEELRTGTMVRRAFDKAVRRKPPVVAADAGPMQIQLREGAVSRCAEAVRQSTTDDSGR